MCAQFVEINSSADIKLSAVATLWAVELECQRRCENSGAMCQENESAIILQLCFQMIYNQKLK